MKFAGSLSRDEKRKPISRALALLMAFTMITSLFSGCGGGTMEDTSGNDHSHHDTEVSTVPAENSAAFETDSFSKYAILRLKDLEETSYFYDDTSVPGTAVTVNGTRAFPPGTQMTVRAVTDSEMEQVEAALNENEAVNGVVKTAVDITFYALQDDGTMKEVQPASPISVKITAAEIAEINQPAVVHIVSEEVEEDATAPIAPTAEVVDSLISLSDADEIQFTADSFSIYAVIETTIETSVLASDGHNYKISVTYTSDAGIPDDAVLAVEEILDTFADYDDYVAKTETALGMAENSAEYIRLFNISILDANGVKVQPKKAVDVKIELADAESDGLSVVHFADGAESGDIVTSETEDGVVSFAADGFSIYVVADGTINYLTYQFFQGSTLLSTQRIKKYISGTNENGYEYDYEELTSPGMENLLEDDEIFIGWAENAEETNDSQIYSIEQLNVQAESLLNGLAPDNKKETIKSYRAVIRKAYFLRYMVVRKNEAGKLMTVQWYIDKVEAKENQADSYYQKTIQTAPSLEEGQTAEGWMDGATGDLYHKGDTITLNHSIDLYLKVTGYYWLVFDSNAGGSGSGATYTPPQILIYDSNSSTNTFKPDDPKRTGYDFVGWNTEPDGSGTWWYKYQTNNDGDVVFANDSPVVDSTKPNRFNNNLSENVTLYAQWVATSAPYYVVLWKQSATDEANLPDDQKNYDYVETIPVNSKTDAQAVIPTQYTRMATTDKQSKYYQTTYNENKSDTAGATVKADGSTVLNVYYDLNVYTLTFQDYTYNYQNNSNSGTYGNIDGQWVQLTRTEQRIWYFKYVYTPTNNNSGYYLNKSTHIYSTTKSNNDGKKYTIDYGDSINNQYTGTRYTKSGNTFTVTTSTTSTQYGVDANGGYVELSSNTNYTYTYTDSEGNTREYTGQRYSRTQASWTWQTVYTITALYGHDISGEFPIKGTNSTTYSGSVWTPQRSDIFTTGDVPSLETMPAESTVFHYKSYGNSHDFHFKYYTESLPGDSGDVRYGGKNYLLHQDVTIKAGDGMGSTKAEDFYDIEGFTQLTSDPEYNEKDSTKYSLTTESDTINFYYTRNQYTINFTNAGAVKKTESVYYEAPLSQYGKNGDGQWFYTPTPTDNQKANGEVFVGWYMDEGCVTAFEPTDDTMPSHNIILYPKWETQRVRTVLVPTPDNEHDNEVSFPNNQALKFRLDYNEKISDANIKSGVAQRLGYKLIGWYTTPDFQDNTLWNFDTQVNGAVQWVNMDYQSSPDWTKYGDNDGKHDNVKGILKLYAKWELSIDTDAVYIRYEVPEDYLVYNSSGDLVTIVPVDNTAYMTTHTEYNENDVRTTHLAAAPSNFNSNYNFIGWKLLNKAGEAIEVVQDGKAVTAPGDELSLEGLKEAYATEIDVGGTPMKVLTFRAAFKIKDEQATQITYDGNYDGAETQTESYGINEMFKLESFKREGYVFLGWSFLEKADASLFENDVKDKDGNVIDKNDNVIGHIEDGAVYSVDEKGNQQLIGYIAGISVAADNLKRFGEELNNADNTLYAVWKRELKVLVTKMGENDIKIKAPEPLDGAEFTLYSDASCTTELGTTTSGKDDGAVIFYFYEDNNSDFYYYKDGEKISLTNKTAYMKETGVPDGYLANTEVYTITLEETGKTDEDDKYGIEAGASGASTETPDEQENLETTAGILGTPIEEPEEQLETADEPSETPTEETGAEEENESAGETSTKETGINDEYTVVGGTLLSGTKEKGKKSTYQILNKKRRTSITLQKQDIDTKKPLTGAEFELYLGSEKVTKENITLDEKSGGSTKIDDLVFGKTYRLKETKAPDGYVISTEGTEFTLSIDGQDKTVITLVESNKDSTAENDSPTIPKVEYAEVKDGILIIKNEPGIALPSTGGMGIKTIYLLSGTMLVLASTVLTRRRKKVETEQ